MLMVDLHCHILPGLDDGAADMEESVRMCSMAKGDGVGKIVATPHTMNGVYVNETQVIKQAVGELNARLLKEQISLEILPGADVHIHPDLLGLIDRGQVTTVNDNHRYLLLELPHQFVPPNFKNLIFELSLEGITPVLTHPERNAVLQNDINQLYELVVQGMLIQITTLSLIGEFGPRAESCCRNLLKYNLVHVIASDAHSSKVRPPLLSPAAEEACRIVGETDALALVTANPQAIIEGRDIPDFVEPEKPKQSFFQRLFG
ncbi:MAG: CpsB/CapC family capsule biosynthesis tyrosine phosphatase [bacterium]